MTGSISAVTATVKGGTFELLADLTAFNRLERQYNKPWFVVLDDFRKNMRIDDVANVFAAFATSGGSPMTPDEAVAHIGDMRGFATAVQYVNQAVNAAMPPKKADGGEGGDDAQDPPA